MRQHVTKLSVLSPDKMEVSNDYKEETTVRVGCTHEMSTAHTPSVLGVITFLTENYTSTRLINQLIDVY